MLKAHRPVGLLQAHHVVATLATLREQVPPDHLSSIVLTVKELLDDDGSFRLTEDATVSSTGASGLVYELLAYAMDLQGLNRAAVAAADEVRFVVRCVVFLRSPRGGGMKRVLLNQCEGLVHSCLYDPRCAT